MEKIKISALNAKEKFVDWIATRGGVQIWKNINLSDGRRGGFINIMLIQVKIREFKRHQRNLILSR
jgi:hypothetical protein